MIFFIKKPNSICCRLPIISNYKIAININELLQKKINNKYKNK